MHSRKPPTDKRDFTTIIELLHDSISRRARIKKILTSVNSQHIINNERMAKIAAHATTQSQTKNKHKAPTPFTDSTHPHDLAPPSPAYHRRPADPNDPFPLDPQLSPKKKFDSFLKNQAKQRDYNKRLVQRNDADFIDRAKKEQNLEYYKLTKNGNNVLGQVDIGLWSNGLTAGGVGMGVGQGGRGVGVGGGGRGKGGGVFDVGYRDLQKSLIHPLSLKKLSGQYLDMMA
jgi:hypothetical protein